MTSQPFSRWRSQHRKSTSGFRFGDASQLRMSKFNCVPNFGNVAQSAAEILVLPVSTLTYPRAIRRRFTKFHPNRTIRGRVMTS